MSAELPDTESGAANTRRRRIPGRDLLRRTLTRVAWTEHPEVVLRWLPAEDALVVDILALPAGAPPLVVHDLLCVEMDGDDIEALPTRICLTGVTTRPDSPAALRTRQLLGATLWAEVARIVDGGGAATTTVVLPDDVRETRLTSWRRLQGVAFGVDVQPGELDVVVLGAQGDDIIGRHVTGLPDMRPEAVVGRISQVVAELREKFDAEIAGAPLLIGVQVPGPVNSATGVVHYFSKRSPTGRALWGWKTDVDLGELVTAATGVRTHVINDVVGYAAYERWFHPAPAEHCRAVLLISQGIGAKLVVGGSVVEWMPMELGNVVVHPSGRPCDCGGRGCLEATAGTLAIVEQVREITGGSVGSIDDAVELAEGVGSGPDARVLAVFRSAGRDLARGIAFVQALVHPSSWAVYGPYALLAKSGSAAGDAFLAALFEYSDFVSFEPYKDSDVRRRPILGTEGAHGAALAVLDGLGLGWSGHDPSCDGAAG